jgi:hypothetical protein
MMRIAAVVAVLAPVWQDGAWAGRTPPELAVAGWVDGESPLTLKGLRGRVVWLQLSWFDSERCGQMRAHLRRWHEAGWRRDLVVVEIDTTMFASLEALRAKYADTPYVVGRDAGTARAFQVKTYPAAFLIGADGAVAWAGDPLADAKRAEALIEAELRKIPPKKRGGGFLGIRFEEVGEGLRVLGLLEGHPAEKTGLRVGDIIVRVGQGRRAIRLNGDVFLQRLWMSPKVTLQVRRGAETLAIETSLAALDAAPRVGDPAPDFTLRSADGKTEVTLSKLVGAKPVVVVFGSYT